VAEFDQKRMHQDGLWSLRAKKITPAFGSSVAGERIRYSALPGSGRFAMLDDGMGSA
jgi:hypothetical protein